MILSSLSCNLYKTPHTRHANPLFNSKYQVPFRHRANTKFNALCARFIIKHAPWKKKKNRATSKESVGRFLCRGTELEKKKEKEKRRNKRKRRILEGSRNHFFLSTSSVYPTVIACDDIVRPREKPKVHPRSAEEEIELSKKRRNEI